MKFTPKEAHILAAQQLLIAMAFREIARQEFEKMENEILQSENYHYDEKYYTSEFKSVRQQFPEDRIIRDRKEIFCISGLDLLDKEGYENTDCYKYYAELKKKATAAGFLHAENAESMADSDVIRLEWEFIKATQDIHNIPLSRLNIMKHRKELIDHLLNLLTPFAQNDSLKENEKKYYNERMRDKVATKNNYSHNEESFLKFQSLKQFIPLEKLEPDTAEQIRKHPLFEKVEGILTYEQFAFLFQIKNKEEKTQSDVLSYAFVNCYNVTIHCDNLEIAERLLFKDFLKSYSIE